nr:DNA polymerase delta subunit 4 [Gasterosteus aculeatus aculeatus]
MIRCVPHRLRKGFVPRPRHEEPTQRGGRVAAKVTYAVHERVLPRSSPPELRQVFVVAPDERSEQAKPSANCVVSVTMTTKGGLITDSFKVVKKAGNRPKREKRPSAPPAQEEPQTATIQEEENWQRLRQFDLDWSFGPCTGISRLQRWQRAKLHGLSPPEEIRDLLLQTHAEYNLSLWSSYPL